MKVSEAIKARRSVKHYDAAHEMSAAEIKQLFEGAMRSIGFAAQNLMLLAKEMGYDSCPMIGFDPAQVAEIINLPADYVVGMMLTIGKATKPAWAKPGQLSYDEVVFHDKF